MAGKNVLAKNENEPRPTIQAFKPAGREDLKADLILAGVFLAGFFLGLLANILGGFSNFMTATERGMNNSVTSFTLQLLVYYGFPLFLIGAVYYLYHAWNYRKKTSYFQKNHIRTEAQITHLWKEPPSGSGKKYFVGYRYNGDQSAFLQIDVYMFKRLQVGEVVPVDYLPDNILVSYPVLPGQKAG